MLPSGLADIVEDEEDVARFLTSSKQFNAVMIKPSAFLPNPKDGKKSEFERVTKEASNAASRYDFDFLVRYLVFFLEQRVPLFWNERGQIEVSTSQPGSSALATSANR